MRGFTFQRAADEGSEEKKFKNALDKRKRLLYDFDPSLLKQQRSSLKIRFNEPISVNIGKLEELLKEHRNFTIPETQKFYEVRAY